jgi:hypothetical protein
MFVLMFSGYIISVSFGIEVMYGIKNMADSIGPLSLALGIFVILIYVIIFVLKIVKSHYFGEFTS